MTVLDRATASQRTAETLLRVGAIHFSADDPFIFTSGWASPVYIDCRRLISYPAERRAVMDDAAMLIGQQIGAREFDSVAGAETAGIAPAAWLSELLDVPMQYVRKRSKGFARDARIEGAFEENQRTLLIDDVATDGRSKFVFCDALRAAGLIVEHVFVLFWYGVFPDSNARLLDHGLALHHLASWADVLEVAEATSAVDGATLEVLYEFLSDPVQWSVGHGGIGEAMPLAQPYFGRPRGE